MVKLTAFVISAFILITGALGQSDDEAIELFLQEYCASDNGSLDEQFEKVIKCRSSEALPGMEESFGKCWKSYMGQVQMPVSPNEWKVLLCGQKDFLKKKNLIAKCTMKPFSPEEENVYNNNVAKCVDSSPTE